MKSLEVMASNDFQCSKNHHLFSQNRALLSPNRNPCESAENPLLLVSEWTRTCQKSPEKMTIACVMPCTTHNATLTAISHA